MGKYLGTTYIDQVEAYMICTGDHPQSDGFNSRYMQWNAARRAEFRTLFCIPQDRPLSAAEVEKYMEWAIETRKENLETP